MKNSYFFYDLETSGTNPKEARIMQFAGQRTDMELNPVGDPVNILIKLSEDILPEPDAILITGITPQKSITDGISEAEFFELFIREIVTEGTVFVGFNNIRFDDEFMRYGLYRNFFDPYEWQWKDGRSRWDILDLTRMTRALRPDGIQWPYAPDGKPTNRLESLTKLNGLDHENAHDALNDVLATIAVARVIKEKQPKLYQYAFDMRAKQEVEKLATSGKPFVYVSGKYSHEFEKTAVVHRLSAHPKKQASFVYDLRFDPNAYFDMPVEQLVSKLRYDPDDLEGRLPVKIMQYNKCPGVAPLNVLREEDLERLKIDLAQIQKQRELLDNNPEFVAKVTQAFDIIEKEYQQTGLVDDQQTADSRLYDGFLLDQDKSLFPVIHDTAPADLSSLVDKLRDERLKSLLPLYKARNFPKTLTSEERTNWEQFRTHRLQRLFPKFYQRLEQIASREDITQQQRFIIEELQLYAESIAPIDL